MVSAKQPEPRETHKSWTFLSNHAHVLVCLARNPHMRLRDIASQVGLTERGVHRIVNELEDAKVVTKTRDGRRNHYKLNLSVHLRHPLEVNRTIGSLLEMLLDPDDVEQINSDSPLTKPNS